MKKSTILKYYAFVWFNIISFVLICNSSFTYADDSEKKATMLDTIVVTATKTPHSLKEVPVETIVITKEDIMRMNAQNAMNILKNIPGIDASVHEDIFGTYTWRAKLEV